MTKRIMLISLMLCLILLSSCVKNHEEPGELPNTGDVKESLVEPNETDTPPVESIPDETSPEETTPPETNAPETTPAETEETTDKEENICGSYIGDELYPIHIPFAGILSYTPGDNTFMATRSEEVSIATNEFLSKYAGCKASRPPLVYYVIHRLDLSREEIEYYYRDSDVSEEHIDALFCEDEEEAKKLLKSPYAFQIGENIYNIYEMQQMTEQKDPSDELIEFMNSNDFKAVMENINNYLLEADRMGIFYDEKLTNYVRSYINQDVAE